jgi:hypothetical protein
LAFALALPLAGLVELGGAFFFAHRAPTNADWAAVGPVLEARRRAGDVIVVAPRWAEPHARAALGDAHFPLAELARADDTRVVRAFELGASGHHAPELATWRQTEALALPGGLLLRILENPRPAHVVTDLLALAERGALVVHRSADGAAYPCTYSEHAPPSAAGLFGPPALGRQQWICGFDPSGNVGLSVVDDEQFRPRRCLLVPVGAQADTVLRFDEVLLGDVLRGHGGVSWTRQRERKGPPVKLGFRVSEGDADAGAIVGEIVHAEGSGFSPFAFPLDRYAGRRATLTITLRSEGGSPHPYCLEADTRAREGDRHE